MTLPQLIKDDTLASQFSYARNLLSIVCVKDIDSVVQGMSKGLANRMGWKSPEDAIYTTDYDIPCDAVILAENFRSIDRQSLTSNCRALTLEMMNSNIGWLSMLVEKTPLINLDGNITGIYCQAFDISSTAFFRYSQILSSTDQKIICSDKQSAVYILNPELSPLPLTPRQQECVFFLIRGKTLKQIADILNLSIRTVESYVEAIKYRLNCTHKTQIIEKAISSGFLYFIPESFLKQDIGKIVT